MKLLFCLTCGDVRKLADPGRLGATETRCHCGRSWGHYTDNINAEFGGNAVLLGVANSSLARALNEQHDKGDLPNGLGRTFEAFIIPNGAPSVTYKG